MKILNIFPIDWNSPDCLPERTWTIPNERGDNFNWITGMFHETITSKINLDLNYNQLADINQIKKLDSFVATRHEIASRYDEAFSELPLKTPFQHKDAFSSYHLYDGIRVC